ncbi:putative glycoprotease family protein [Phaeoacremonium minimum UCRPA7]|uniref:Putative glycoprotease family protein n=1 Tax=Phaeoacremonium minimum (strain UCR-PA7) TaxID=1286976 RepID=R8BRY2_PHAM7|nr:putative glycoprotease family protein [Phaeoacremonium minimum UCRPA7]EOO02101.1 putative glycoprotease family protein [Phaeoacremonium minimum UCRPA7]
MSTVVGPENPVTVTGCTQPLTLWTCSLPKEQQAANEPYKANQPKFIMQIQYDNSTKQLWNVKDAVPPHPTSNGQETLETGAERANETANANKGNGTDGSLAARDVQTFDEGFAPNPLPPSFQEMWFLGNTTDGIVSDRKAGEPTPFFISFFDSLNQTAGPNMLPEALARRGSENTLNARDVNLTGSLPPPDLNPDGTGAAAKLLAYPFQQPLRLFDRGLPTEHYGFYSYYNKTLYVKSVTPLNENTADQGNVPADKDGGCLETEANFLITWTQTRFHVQIWTRMGNGTNLLQGAPDNSTRPGTMPYAVTVSVDTHGGDYSKKASFYYGVDDRQHINRTNTKLISNDVGFDSPRINPGFSADLSLGGIDGGTGGCRCSWVNFLNENGKTLGIS